MTEYKLNYFNAKGRAEIIRLIFAAAGQKYEDHRFESDKWPEYKSKSPTGKCPWLEIHEDGKIYYLAQSITIGNLNKIQKFKKIIILSQ